MKKIMIALVGFLSVAAIIVVVFFGALPFSKESNIYCDYILMNMQTIMHNDEVIAEVLTRPSEKDIKVGDPWFDNDYSYRINVHNLNYLINSSHEGKFSLYCKAMTNKVGKLVSDPKLNYYVSSPENWSDMIDENEYKNGVIKFNNDTSKLSSFMQFTFKVQSNDAHGKSINIRMQSVAYTSMEESNL